MLVHIDFACNEPIFFGDRLMTFGLMTFVASLILGSTYLFTNFAMVLFELVVL